jgi:AraC-like DNA-binding protein
VKEYFNQIPILNANVNGRTGSPRLLPIQAYPMRQDAYIGYPSKPYKNFVSFYHQIRGNGTDDKHIYPAGCSAIVCRLECQQPESFVVGTPTFCRIAEYSPPSSCTFFVVFFWPSMGYTIFPNPTTEIVDKSIPLSEVFPELAKPLTEGMDLAKTFYERIIVFERFLSKILVDSRSIPVHHQNLIKIFCNETENLLDHNIRRIYHNIFTDRHIRRLLLKYLGLSPNLYSRIIRYQKSLHLLSSNPEENLAEMAVSLGYFDQSHFIKEFKRFHGETPVEFIRRFCGLVS